MSDFEFARDKILMGSERKSMVISEEEKKIRPIMKWDTPWLPACCPEPTPFIR